MSTMAIFVNNFKNLLRSFRFSSIIGVYNLNISKKLSGCFLASITRGRVMTFCDVHYYCISRSIFNIYSYDN